jgi:hypothetical protein
MRKKCWGGRNALKITYALGMLYTAASTALAEPATCHTHEAPRVEAFYRWYIARQSQARFPLMDAHIYDYVAKGTADRLRSAYEQDRLPGDSDYFTKVQDYDDRDWAAHIVAQPARQVGDVSIVPVTFGSTEKNSVLVFLRCERGRWKIVKVDDLLDD